METYAYQVDTDNFQTWEQVSADTGIPVEILKHLNPPEDIDEDTYPPEWIDIPIAADNTRWRIENNNGIKAVTVQDTQDWERHEDIKGLPIDQYITGYNDGNYTLKIDNQFVNASTIDVITGNLPIELPTEEEHQSPNITVEVVYIQPKSDIVNEAQDGFQGNNIQYVDNEALKYFYATQMGGSDLTRQLASDVQFVSDEQIAEWEEAFIQEMIRGISEYAHYNEEHLATLQPIPTSEEMNTALLNAYEAGEIDIVELALMANQVADSALATIPTNQYLHDVDGNIIYQLLENEIFGLTSEGWGVFDGESDDLLHTFPQGMMGYTQFNLTDEQRTQMGELAENRTDASMVWSLSADFLRSNSLNEEYMGFMGWDQLGISDKLDKLAAEISQIPDMVIFGHSTNPVKSAFQDYHSNVSKAFKDTSNYIYGVPGIPGTGLEGQRQDLYLDLENKNAWYSMYQISEIASMLPGADFLRGLIGLAGNVPLENALTDLLFGFTDLDDVTGITRYADEFVGIASLSNRGRFLDELGNTDNIVSRFVYRDGELSYDPWRAAQVDNQGNVEPSFSLTDYQTPPDFQTGVQGAVDPRIFGFTDDEVIAFQNAYLPSNFGPITSAQAERIQQYSNRLLELTMRDSRFIGNELSITLDANGMVIAANVGINRTVYPYMAPFSDVIHTHPPQNYWNWHNNPTTGGAIVSFSHNDIRLSMMSNPRSFSAVTALEPNDPILFTMSQNSNLPNFGIMDEDDALDWFRVIGGGRVERNQRFIDTQNDLQNRDFSSDQEMRAYAAGETYRYLQIQKSVKIRIIVSDVSQIDDLLGGYIDNTAHMWAIQEMAEYYGFEYTVTYIGR